MVSAKLSLGDNADIVLRGSIASTSPVMIPVRCRWLPSGPMAPRTLTDPAETVGRSRWKVMCR